MNLLVFWIKKALKKWFLFSFLSGFYYEFHYNMSIFVRPFLGSPTSYPCQVWRVTLVHIDSKLCALARRCAARRANRSNGSNTINQIWLFFLSQDILSSGTLLNYLLLLSLEKTRENSAPASGAEFSCLHPRLDAAPLTERESQSDVLNRNPK